MSKMKERWREQQDRDNQPEPTEKPRFRKAADWALNLLMKK